MLNSWQQWCRLCAKENGAEIDVFLKSENGPDLSQAIQKYFLITITPFDEYPTKICTACYKFITNLVLFADHSSRVENVFAKIIFNEFTMMDLNKLKFEHGLSEFVFSFFDVIQKFDQTTETNDLIIEEEDEIHTIISPANKLKSKLGKHTEKRSHKIVKKQEDANESSTIKPELLNNINKFRNSIEFSEQTKEEESISDNENNFEVENEETESKENKTDLIKKRSKRIKNKKKFDETFQCDKCPKSFKRDFILKQHMRRSHLADVKKSYPCSKCDKCFPTEKRLDQHETVHLPRELKFPKSCSYCNRKFIKSANIEEHIRAIHKGEKPVICEECGKSFRTNSDLKMHQVIHTDETPFGCKKCPKKFKNMARLKIHEDTHNETGYICPECGLKLNTKRTLQMHMVVHSDQKEYKCDYCGNAYKRLKALKNHLIIHTGLRPYTCPFCDKTFANGSNCRKHKKLSHPVELAAMEAAGEVQPAINIPKLSQLKAGPAIQVANNVLLNDPVSLHFQ